MVGARYFGKKKIPLHKAGEEPWSERKYFRRLEKVENKLGGMLIVAGITKEFFETRLMGVELIKKVYRHVQKRERGVR